MPASSLKQHRSRTYRALSLSYLLFPVVFLPVVVFLLDIPAGRVGEIARRPLFLVISLLAMLTGYGLLEVRRWGWYLLNPVQVLVVLLAGHLSIRYGSGHYPIIAFLVLTALAALAHRGISRELRVPYFMPKISWWESDPKFTIRIPAQVVNSSGRALEADILDLSRLGCFVKCRPDFSEGEVVEIRCRLFGREWTAGGVVVWKTFGAVTHPRGIGVKFGAMERPAARILKAAAVKLARISKLNSTGRYWLSSEEYASALAKLRAPLPGRDSR